MSRAGTASHTPHTSNPEEGIIGAVPSSSKIHETERGCKGLASSSCALGDHGHSSGSANGGSSGSPEEECMPDESGIGFMSSAKAEAISPVRSVRSTGCLSLLGIPKWNLFPRLHACTPDDIYPCMYDRTWFELISVFFWPSSAPTLTHSRASEAHELSKQDEVQVAVSWERRSGPCRGPAKRDET